MAKFDKAHAEIRLYLPLDSEVWQDFRESKVYTALMQAGLMHVHNAARQANKGERQ